MLEILWESRVALRTPDPIPVNLVGGGVDSNLTPAHQCYEPLGAFKLPFISQRDLVASLDQILFNGYLKPN